MYTLETYERGDAVAFSWHIDDVKGFDPSLTDEEAREILKNFERHHDGSQQAMWDDLEYHVDEFKKGKE